MYDTEQFITEIELQPAIWDSNKEIYNNKVEKSKAWDTVCYKLFPNYPDKSPNEKNEIAMQLKRRWKSLRDSYTREVGRIKRSKGEVRRQYVFFNQLNFLHSVVAVHNKLDYNGIGGADGIVGNATMTGSVDGNRSADDSNADDMQQHHDNNAKEDVAILGDIWSSAAGAAAAATSTTDEDIQQQQTTEDNPLGLAACTSDDLWHSNPPPDLWNVAAEVQHVTNCGGDDDTNNIVVGGVGGDAANNGYHNHHHHHHHQQQQNNNNNNNVTTDHNINIGNHHHHHSGSSSNNNNNSSSNGNSLKRKKEIPSYAEKHLYDLLDRSIRLRLKKEINLENDGDKLFMLSLVPDLKSMPENLKLEVKCEIMNIFKKFKNFSYEQQQLLQFDNQNHHQHRKHSGGSSSRRNRKKHHRRRENNAVKTTTGTALAVAAEQHCIESTVIVDNVHHFHMSTPSALSDSESSSSLL